MKDIKQRIEKLLIDAEDCAIISRLATNPAKREAFQKLADEYRAMARELGTIVLDDAVPNNTDPK